TQHPLIADQGCVAPLVLPVSWKLHELDASAARPGASYPINAAGVAFNQRRETVLRMKAIKLRMDEGLIRKIATATHQDFQMLTSGCSSGRRS
ncbi:MAG TPA: hypothetical protein VFB29_04485, partial [Pseudolabrys sp.]|nr:hypothetical protein [Pseudolabrys sp.]